MKTTKLSFLLVAIAAFFITQSVEAKTWRVNNNSNFNGTTLFGSNMGGSAAYPVFPQLNNAVGWSGVVNGDTIHMEGSNVLYNIATITKRLVIIGPGYFLDENPNTSNDVLAATIALVVFNTGSSGSQMMGMNIVPGSNTNNRIYLNVNDLTVKRCRIAKAVEIGTAVSDIIITDNFFPVKLYLMQFKPMVILFMFIPTTFILITTFVKKL